jgi:hypothetical protein
LSTFFPEGLLPLTGAAAFLERAAASARAGRATMREADADDEVIFAATRPARDAGAFFLGEVFFVLEAVFSEDFLATSGSSE